MALSRIEAALAPEWTLAPVDDLDGLTKALTAPACHLLILDLDTGDAESVVGLARPAGVPVLAFGPHVDASLLRAARDAGCAVVVPRSSFFAELADLAERAAAGSTDRQTA